MEFGGLMIIVHTAFLKPAIQFLYYPWQNALENESAKTSDCLLPATCPILLPIVVLADLRPPAFVPQKRQDTQF